METTPQLAFDVPGMTCEHCVRAVTDEVSKTVGGLTETIDVTRALIVDTSDDVKLAAASGRRALASTEAAVGDLNAIMPKLTEAVKAKKGG